MSPCSSSSQNRRPRAILFDYDGVVIDSESLHWRAWAQLMIELGADYDEAREPRMMGRPAPLILETLLRKHCPHLHPDEAESRRLIARKNDFFLEYAREGLKPFPGVVEGLGWLQEQKIPAAIVSNARRRELENTLQQLQLAPLFTLTVSREDIGIFKPDPAPYLYAMAQLEVEAQDCIAIEDSPPGLESALWAKVPAVAVLTNFKQAELQAPIPGRPDLVPLKILPDTAAFFEWLKKRA